MRHRPESLVRSLDAYRALVQATSSLIWRWTAEGGVIEGEGWDVPRRHTGNEWLASLHPDDREAAAAVWARAAQDGRPMRLEFRARTRSGEYRWCVSHAVPILDARGHVVEWIGNLVDVQDERSAREALQRKEKLEAVGRLTARVAHDFNNLLTVIISGAETLVEVLPERDSRRGEAKLIMHAAERGAQLVRRLLAISRQQPLNPQTIDVRAMLESLVGLVRRTIGAEIEVIVHHSREPLYCTADPAQLESALLNLCLNARDAMQSGGRLWLETERVAFGDEAASHLDLRPGAYAMISVRDSGVGMSADTIDRALDPFFTTKPSGGGSGLGLSSAYGFVQQSGGHFAISSDLGRGTAISIYLPETGPAKRSDGRLSLARRTTAGAHILLVEDDGLVRNQVTRQLRALGYRVTAVGGGRAALRALAAQRDWALLMTDVAMPGGMDGRSVAVAARRIRPQLPVLFTSGFTDDVLLREGRSVIDAPFLPKPYQREQLARAVEQALAPSQA